MGKETRRPALPIHLAQLQPAIPNDKTAWEARGSLVILVFRKFLRNLGRRANDL